MKEREFQRARSPAQRAERRVGLVQTAERLLRERGDVSAFSLNELAREAGMSKSNVYRYFESRESLLLEILESQWQKWFLAFDQTMLGKCSLELELFCDALCRSIAEYPLLCSLMASLPSVLEHNASTETIRGFKLRSVESMEKLGHYCHQFCGQLTPQEFEKLMHLITVTLTGLWPYAHPCPAVREALEDPQLSHFRHDFPRDLSETVTLLALGMVAKRS